MFFLFFMISCSKSSNKDANIPSHPPSHYDGYLPNFSVNIPKDAINLNSSFLVPLQGLRSPNLKLEENQTSIDCTEALNNWNAAPQFPLQGTDTPFCPETETCHDNELGFTINFYAQAQFYDCNARQQLREDGLTQQCPLREGDEEASLEELCDEESSTSIQLLYALIQGDQPEDFTRFVSWTMDPNTPEASDIQGRLINKYLQDNGLRTKTRVNLEREGGRKTVDSIFLYYDSSNEPQSSIRAYFREDGASSVTDNYIVGRYWNTSYGKVIAVRAHVKSSTGAALFVEICPADDFAAAQASTCTASGATPVYFDANGDLVVASPEGLINTGSDDRFNPRNTSNNLDTFFDDETIEDHFNPENFNPSN